ncbi:hypothetical protein F2P81_009512 [Scophthalmus maximus]|uniref:Rap1 GTPase-GDP dissociation stimulator 1 n=1 Tax=Scophthalmus maximus TaxID=52904 RepID=A0A6A4T3W2_SCOMX|nr:hypothetical protein F2P81_009512 [Scophthalmus maximus]
MDNLSEALEKLKLASTDCANDSVEGCLDCLLKALANKNTEASMKIREMGVLPLLPTLLSPQSSCTPKVANVIAEVAKNEFMRSSCVEAGLIPPLIQLLNSTDQEVLLQTGRALGNIYEGRRAVDLAGGAQIVAEHIKSLYQNTEPENEKLLTVFCGMLMNYSNDNDSLQAQLINMGVIPTLVKLLGLHSHNTALTEMCLIAFGNLAELESSKEQFATTNIAEELVCLFQKQTEHEKKEMIFEVLAPLAENDVIKLQLVEAGLVESLLEVVAQTVDGEREEDIAQLKTASDLMVLLLLGVVNKSKMLSAGVADVVLKFLQSEMPPVQFKLLGTLRMLIDTQAEAADQLGTNGKLVERLVEWCEAKDHAGVMGESNRLLSALIRHSKSKEVVRTVILGGGVKHLVTMATSEHMIMQNEALVALGLIAALDLVAAEKDFVGANLVSVLHKLLSDERSAPEIKYNSMILICAVMGSEPLHKEVQSLAFIDVVSKLRAHENKTVSHQASLTEQRLTAQS